MNTPNRIAAFALAFACAEAAAENSAIEAAQLALDKTSSLRGIYVVAVDAVWQHARQTMAGDGSSAMDFVFGDAGSSCGPDAPPLFHVKLVPLQATRDGLRVDAYLFEQPCADGEAGTVHARDGADESRGRPAIPPRRAGEAPPEDSYELDLGHGNMQTLSFGQRSVSISFTEAP